MRFGLQDRTALVSGASSGIGRTVATALAAEGARVVIGYHSNAEAANAVVESIHGSGGRARAVGFDITDPGTIRVALAEIEREWDGPTVLVSSGAPFPSPGPFSELDDDGWHAALRDQLEGPGNLMRAVLPSMLRTGWGRIVLLSTVHAQNGNAGVVAHTAAKSGLHGLTRSLAKEVGRSGVLVNAVLPGLVATPEAAQRFGAQHFARAEQSIPTGHASTPEDIAALAVFLGSAANGNVTGELIRCAGGM